MAAETPDPIRPIDDSRLAPFKLSQPCAAITPIPYAERILRLVLPPTVTSPPNAPLDGRDQLILYPALNGRYQIGSLHFGQRTGER